MKYYISEKDKKDRADRLSSFLLDFKRKLDNPNFRTKHNLNKWKHIKNTTNKTLSSLGYKLNLETKELRNIIPMKIKDNDKIELALAQDNLEMIKRKYISIKQDLIKAKEDYKNKLNEYKDKMTV